MRGWTVGLFLIVVGPSWAADAIIKDGDTLRLGDTTFRLDGIDAPEGIVHRREWRSVDPRNSRHSQERAR